MSVSAVQFNPFQAPEVEPEIVMKTPKEFDVPYGEFRIFEKHVYISSDVEFPPVCIRTGDTEDIACHTAEVQFASPSAQMVVAVVGVFTYPVILGLMGLSAMIASNYPTHYFEVITTVFLSLCGVFGYLFGMVTKQLRSPTKVHYFESQEWRETRNKRNRLWFWTTYTILCLAFLSLWQLYGKLYLFPFVLMMPFCWLAKTPPFMSMRHHGGVFLLSRMPVEFLRDNPFCDVVSPMDGHSTDRKDSPDTPRWASHIEA